MGVRAIRHRQIRLRLINFNNFEGSIAGLASFGLAKLMVGIPSF